MKGILISFEGGEGGGKTTQATRLKRRLEKAQKKVVACREPGGTEVSERIRKIVLDKGEKELRVMTEVLLMQAARAQMYGQVVLPALRDGKIVVCDRTRDSSVVYQGMVRRVGVEIIEKLNDLSTERIKPDLVILLDVEVKTGMRRREKEKGKNRIDLEEESFHEQVRQGYLKVASENRKRWRVVDATWSLNKVEKEVWKIVKKRFKI